MSVTRRLYFKRMSAPFPNQSLWGCRWKRWSFVIEYQPALRYSASWKDAQSLAPSSANRLDKPDGFPTIEEAVAACEAKAAELDPAQVRQ